MSQSIQALFPEKSIQQKWAFVTSVMIMLITHLYMFTNKIVNHDDVNRLIVGDTNEAKIQHGRWAGVIFDPVSGSSVGIPYLMGILSTLAFAGTAVVLVSIFKIRKKASVILLCGLLCTFPVSANIFLYSYIADIYFISMFLAVWGVWLILQNDNKMISPGKLPGVILLTLACGCYQAFWCLGMAFLFLSFFLELLDLQGEWKNFAFKAVKCLLMAVVSLVLYLVINKIVQSVTGYGATAYEGLDAMGQYGGLVGFLKVVAIAYYEFVQFFYLKGSFVFSYVIIAFNLLLTIFVVVMLLRRAKQNRHPRGYWVVFIFFIGCIPLASNLVSVVSMNATHILMQYAFLLPYFLCLILLDRSGRELDGKKSDAMMRTLSYLLLALIVYKGFLTDNEVYFRQQLNYEATYSYTLRMLSRIETMDGYEPDTRIAVINENPQEYDHITIMLENYPEEMTHFDYLNGMQGTEPHTFVKRANDIADFCKYYHGYDLQLVDDDAILQELGKTAAFREMETYPNEGGMRFIDDILVIKLSDGVRE